MRKLEGHLECDVFLRGNVITLNGDADAVGRAVTVVRELAELIDGGHDIGPGTIDAVTSALDQHASPAKLIEDVVWSHRAVKIGDSSGGESGCQYGKISVLAYKFKTTNKELKN